MNADANTKPGESEPGSTAESGPAPALGHDGAVVAWRLLRRARAEIAGFHALYDSQGPSLPACVLWARAWSALDVLDAFLSRRAPRDTDEELRASLFAEVAEAPPDDRHGPSAELVARLLAASRTPADAEPALPTARELARARRALVRSLTTLEKRTRRRFPPPPFRWRRWAAVTMAPLAVVVLAAQAYGALHPSPWRVAYYSNPDLSGTPDSTGTRHSPDADWDIEGPAGLPTDNFSIRYETCLELARAESIAFEIGSDDGSRLFVDDTSVIDQWFDHAFETRSYTLRLEPGVHALRLEYYERVGGARVSFSARTESSGASVAPLLRAPSRGRCERSARGAAP